MADEIWVNGEQAHKNTPKFVNKGGVPGVSAGTVNQAAFNVRNKHIAREWLFNELKRQKYREMYNAAEEQAKKILLEHEVLIDVALNSGSAQATAWGCDLTYDYVKINGDYRT